MEEYNKIYPELSKEPPKDGNAFRLQQSCRVLENLEKEAKHYASVRKKYKRCYNLLSRTSTLSGTLSFCLSGSGVGTAFSGVGLPLAASLGGLGLICGVVSVITGEAGKKVSRKVTKHEKTVSVCESKIIALKTESQKLWRMTGFPTKSSKKFSPRCQNIMSYDWLWRKSKNII